MTMLEKIRYNLFLKLLALLLAVIIWLFVKAEEEAEIGISAPLEVKNLAAGLVVTGDIPKVLDIRLAGPRIQLMMPALKSLRVPVDLMGIKEGRVVFTGFEKRLHLPRSVRLTRISPASLELNVEKKKD
jgi:YbbR domain-containing protein